MLRSWTTKKNLGVTLFLTLIGAVGVRAQAPASNPKTQTLKVDVDLVLVNATVTDTLGRMVTGLQKENFQLWEDKVEQKIEYFSSEDTPLSIGLIFDATGSMSDKISTARDAATTFLKMGNPEDEFFLVTFSQEPRLAEDFTTDITRLQQRLLFTPAKGLTPLFDAVYLGLDKMRSASNKRRALLLITDGEDNHSRYSFADIKEFARERDVQIFAIGIVNPFGELAQGKTGRAIIEDLVEITGGRAFFPDSVTELEDICTKIGIELKNEYVLGYHSTNEHIDLEGLSRSSSDIEELRHIILKIHPWSSLHYGFTALDTVVRLYTKTIPEFYGKSCEIQILTPQVRGTLGTLGLNQQIQQATNPEKPGTPQITIGEKLFREGDRVIQTRNNYDLGVFNGDIGRIQTIDPEDYSCRIHFGSSGQVVTYPREDLTELALAYAVTIHKSQGSEFETVIIPVHAQHFKMLFRNLIYTAVTRAKKLAVFVGSREALAMAVRTIDSRKRQTALSQLISQYSDSARHA